MEKLTAYIKLMRPHHYIKNILIFLPIIFAKDIFNWSLMKTTIIGAIAFSLMSSIVYIINDIHDVEEDRKHEVKKNRPIASGKVSIKGAYTLAIILFIITIVLSAYICLHEIDISINNVCAYILVFYGYLIINILYSIKLKNIPIMDVTILALGFLIRVIYGALITGISISNWLFLTILAFSLYMGLAKRRNELIQNDGEGRKVLSYYNQSFLDNNMYACMTLGIVFYSLWCLDMNASMESYINIIYTIPLVLIICMKYSLDIEKGTSGDPINVILNDKILLLLGIIYAAIIFVIIYL